MFLTSRHDSLGVLDLVWETIKIPEGPDWNLKPSLCPERMEWKTYQHDSPALNYQLGNAVAHTAADLCQEHKVHHFTEN